MIPGTALEEINRNSIKIGTEAHGRRCTAKTMNLMFLIYGTSPSAYSLLKHVMDLPTISSIYQIFGPEMKEQEILPKIEGTYSSSSKNGEKDELRKIRHG
jgi:hypothetical protein